MAYSPNTDNYTLGKGVVYFNRKNSSGVYLGERDLGNAPAFTFNVDLEKLEHYSSRGGLRAKDKEIVSEITPGVAFDLDEVTKENLALLTMAELNEVVQTSGSVSAEVVTANLGMRATLSKREIANAWLLPYDGGSTIFAVGETVTGAGGAAGIVMAVTGDATSGTLTIIKTNDTAFVDDEAITGSGSGSADVNSTSGGSESTVPAVFVQDSIDTTTYVAGTDYEVSTVLKDNTVGRILILSGGSISEGEELHVTFGYAATTYTEVRAFKETQVEGFLRFVSDNPAGSQQELKIWRASLTPSGDTAMIGEDWSTLSFEGEILKDETGHPDSPYFDIIM